MNLTSLNRKPEDSGVVENIVLSPMGLKSTVTWQNVYCLMDEVRAMAQRLLRYEPNAHSIQPTARLGRSGLLEVFIRLCDALEHVHRQGIIHRDLMPDNILVDDQGEPRIIDFGLTQAYAKIPTGDWPDCISGTPAYMSPEQISAGLAPLTPASDVYTLGVILYKLLSGQHPYQVPPIELSKGVAKPVVGASSKPLRRYLSGCSERL